MKRLASIGSTKPEQFLYTDFSTIPQSDNPKHSITRILNYIKNMLKMRPSVYFCDRDTEELYQLEPIFFNSKFNVQDGKELWAQICTSNTKSNKKDETYNPENQDNEIFKRAEIKQSRGGEKQIISLFTKIIIMLTNQKNECAEEKKFENFADLKSLIDWLEDRSIDLQKMIRDKIKDNQLKKKESIQLKRSKQFFIQEEKIKQILDQQKKLMQETLKGKQIRERIQMDLVTNDRIQKSLFLHLPSNKLKQAKDLSLLAKLAPYKSEKKRPFECKSLQSSLYRTVQLGKEEINQKLQHFKAVERRKLKAKHQIQTQHKSTVVQSYNRKVISQVNRKRDQQKNSQKIQIQRLIKENNRLTNQRLISLKKSLNAYSMHDETRKIKQIIRKHHDTVQYVNDIGKIGITERHSRLSYYDTKIQTGIFNTSYGNRTDYQTLDPSTQWESQKQKWIRDKSATRYADLNVQKKLIRKIRNQQTEEEEGGMKSSGRKSLIDLYDSELKERR